MTDKNYWLEKWQLKHCSEGVIIREAWTNNYSHCRMPGGETFKCGKTCPYFVLQQVKS